MRPIRNADDAERSPTEQISQELGYSMRHRSDHEAEGQERAGQTEGAGLEEGVEADAVGNGQHQGDTGHQGKQGTKQIDQHLARLWFRLAR